MAMEALASGSRTRRCQRQTLVSFADSPDYSATHQAVIGLIHQYAPLFLMQSLLCELPQLQKGYCSIHILLEVDLWMSYRLTEPTDIEFDVSYCSGRVCPDS
jgi:hypothetical protein